ncbi:MAG TPA: type II CAAX endopeptidase family protein [Steroidobacteraceae bacterium]
MKERILRLSGAFELSVVLLLAFGLTVPGNLLALLSPTYLAQRTTPPVNNAALVGTLVYELVIMCILIPFLKARGWNRERLGFLPSIQDTVWGVGLLGAYYVIVLVFESILGSVWPQVVIGMSHIHLNAGHFDWGILLAVSIVNPVFEELFVCAYLITALKERFGATTAINVSAGIRVFYHFYQGALAVLSITPLALLFGYWFARTGRLWPLIVAHALQDFIALSWNNG